MSILANLFSSWWATLLGLGGVVSLIIGGMVFFMGWPVVTPFLNKIFSGLGDWAEYNLSLELDGWKTISQSAAALIFLATAMMGTHIVDKYYFLKQDEKQICATMMKDLYAQYKFVEKPKPKSKWHL